MKKVLSISFCLMLFISSLLMLTACEVKPKPVSQVEVEKLLTSAVSKMVNEKVVKINMPSMGFIAIKSDTISYFNFMGMESWEKLENDNMYEYSIIDFNSEKTYTKKLVIPNSENDDNLFETDMDMDVDAFKDAEFVEASLVKDEYSISYKLEEGGEKLTYTYVITNKKIKEISVRSGLISMSMQFEFGEHVLNQIPQIPTDVEWVEYEPCIVVDGLPTEFEIGDTLDLENVTIEFYEDSEMMFFPETFDIDMSMISGFNTTTVTGVGETRTMTVYFYGLIYEVEYIVTPPAGAE